MRGFGYQNPQKARSSGSYRADTSQHKKDLLDILKQAQSLWRDQKVEESMVKLKKAISILEFIIGNESILTVKVSFEQKLVQLRQRLMSRQKSIQKGTALQPQYQAKGKDDQQLRGQMIDNILNQKPNVKWSDIAGLQGAKNALKEAIIMPIRFKKMFTGCRKPWKGILLYGPPGTGKTYLAKACATETQATFFAIQPSKIMSKYVGESQKMIGSLFALAREKKPSIIFIDEIDSLCGSRTEGQNDATKRVKSQFLIQMQGVGNDDDGVLILGATNFPEALDFAIRRRFQRRIYIPLPEQEARCSLFKNQLKEIQHQLTQVDFRTLAESTEGYSGSDIKSLIKDAVYGPIRTLQNAKKFKKLPNGKWKPCNQLDLQGEPKTWLQFEDENDLEFDIIKITDFYDALIRTKPSVDQKQLKKYEQWTKNFGQDG